ncbi:MAG: efflux RND transporter periplasmic adaptor subunit [Actinobacteria bacterium]|nr:efflux RND transporter periplasmic adaptor subunit [Actinomycetota bacterium]
MYKYFIAIISIIFLAGCGHRQEKQVETKAIAEQRIPVKAAPVVEDEISERIKMTGEIASLRQIDILPTAAGKIIDEKVTLGQKVKKGQALAHLIQDVPGMEFSPVAIEATISGHITRDGVEVGAKVSPQKAVYTISQIDSVYMLARVMESDLAKVKINMPVLVQVDTYPGKIFRGRVSQISPLLDGRSRTATAKVVLANSNLELKPGMFARCSIESGKRYSLVIPLDAVIHRGTLQYVYKIEGDSVIRMAIQTGAIVDSLVEVSGRLAAEDRVVVYGQNLLRDGSLVNIQP